MSQTNRHLTRATMGVVAMLALLVGLAACASSGSESADDDSTTTTEATSAADDTTTTAADEGDDAGEATDAAYQQAIQENLTAGSKQEGNLVVADGEAACVAPKWLEVITGDHLREIGVSPADLADPSFDYSSLELDGDGAQALIDAFDPCGVDLFAELGSSLTMGLTEEQQACAAENIDHDLATTLLRTAFSTTEGTGDAEFEALMAQLTEACDLPS